MLSMTRFSMTFALLLVFPVPFGRAFSTRFGFRCWWSWERKL